MRGEEDPDYRENVQGSVLNVETRKSGPRCAGWDGAFGNRKAPMYMGPSNKNASRQSNEEGEGKSYGGFRSHDGRDRL